MSLEHAHGVATPFVEGKGVNAKGFMTKANLSRATQVVDEMCLKEFGVSYRTYQDPQHKSIEELKSETNIARNEMQKVIDTQNKMIDQNRDTIIKQNDKIVENQMEMTELDTALQDMRSENRSLQTENDNFSKHLESQEIELANLQNLTKNNADLQNLISNEQNRIEDARDYLELDNADDFDYER